MSAAVAATVGVLAFFAAVLGLLALSSASPVLAFGVACVAGAVLMVLFFVLGRRTVLIAVTADEVEAP